ncbi:MAG: H(+)-transporting V1 sector ATPase subunit H [Alyxoria varia]|nr:MAG: H(+)-transporting V1 sector ATPase subunit H [Alyxoria varia]
MSLNPPEYITSLQNNIRARPISWDGAVRAKTITDDDLKKIKSIDKVRKEQRRQTIESDLQGFRKLFLGENGSQSIFEAAAKRPDIIQYLLVLSGDLVDDIPPFVETLIGHPNPYKPFLPFLQQSSNPEDPIPLLTSSVLSSLISQALVSPSSSSNKQSSQHIAEAIPKLNAYISNLAKSADSGLQDIAVQEYSALLRTKESRKLFWDQREDTLNPLADILRTASGGKDSDSTKMNGASSIRSTATDVGLSGGVGIQLLYHVLLVFWQLSFEGELVGKGLDEEHDIIPLYTQLLRVSPKEKITRLLLATLNNLLSTNQQILLPAAMQARLPTLLSNIKSRVNNDPDMLDDHESLKTMLDEYSTSQTTFDEYAAEVRSGHLRWSPPHRNAAFWKENARMIVDEDKGELPKKLAEILAKEWESDKQVLAVGCNDVAWLVKECPDRKTTLEKVGLKARIMELMGESQEESVRWEGLRAVGEWLRYSFDK